MFIAIPIALLVIQLILWGRIVAPAMVHPIKLPEFTAMFIKLVQEDCVPRARKLCAAAPSCHTAQVVSSMLGAYQQRNVASIQAIHERYSEFALSYRDSNLLPFLSTCAAVAHVYMAVIEPDGLTITMASIGGLVWLGAIKLAWTSTAFYKRAPTQLIPLRDILVDLAVEKEKALVHANRFGAIR